MTGIILSDITDTFAIEVGSNLDTASVPGNVRKRLEEAAVQCLLRVRDAAEDLSSAGSATDVTAAGEVKFYIKVTANPGVEVGVVITF